MRFKAKTGGRLLLGEENPAENTARNSEFAVDAAIVLTFCGFFMITASYLHAS